MKLFYGPDYVSSDHDFDTTRKAGWIADSLRLRPIPGAAVTTPEPLTDAQLLLAHTPDYVAAVRTGSPGALAESQGFEWNPHAWTSAVASNGGVLAAARAALTDGVSGSLSSGLHHAKSGRGEGFCTFNGLVVAAKTLLTEGAVSSVLIVDLDAHCGGGTAQMIADEPRIVQVDVSVDPYDSYDSTPNSTLREVFSAGDYLPAVRAALPAGASFDLCLYNAGMDPHERCAIGGLDGVDADLLGRRDRLIFEWCRARGIPVAFVLAGGYTGSRLDQNELVNLHRMTISEAARSTARQSVA
ncbi:hypothetical protein KIH27_17985 [Mycobacterium sp. M1]|uniref:Histone deacetylase domain-containing protein n=1 Tax=Mycolicibacter acidiphilus TaxID=2835306 RepID=A0ABS5RPG2_9MYCO|nr:hypothetical protein [Mycolicibacter acidiphilus]MBS9535479.1 hypothetical protein [Mycolicibacter acidiphilus]